VCVIVCHCVSCVSLCVIVCDVGVVWVFVCTRMCACVSLCGCVPVLAMLCECTVCDQFACAYDLLNRFVPVADPCFDYGEFSVLKCRRFLPSRL
jgi:hypothetical protein